MRTVQSVAKATPSPFSTSYANGLFVLGIVFMLALSHYFFWQIGDDSYIYFRYVDRAVQGFWSWTDYSGPVEGYSSPLWYGLLVGAAKLGFSVDLSARFLGLCFSFLTLYGGYLLANQLKLSAFYIALAGLLLVLNKGFHFWASSGLETSLYAALYTWAALGILRQKYWLLPLALIGVARPEGIILLFALSLALFIFRRHYLNSKTLLLLWLPALVWQGVRYVVYGDVLANTFYAKATGALSDQLAAGLFYCLPVLLPLLLLWLCWFFSNDKNKQDVLVLLGMISLLTGIVLVGGGDWMFFMRLLVPVLALLWVCLIYYFVQGGYGQKLLLILSASLLLLGSVPPKQLAMALIGKSLPIAQYQEGYLTAQSIALAAMIKENFSDKKRIAVNHAGALPWALPDFDVIDMVGLNDKHIARVKGDLHQKYDPGYVLSLKPDLIVLNSRVRPGKDGLWYHSGYWAGETALVNLPEFQKNYQKTPMILPWIWHIPWPYSSYAKQNPMTSWILLYQRKTSMPK